MVEQALTSEDLAQVLKVSKRKAQRLLRYGQVESFRIGGEYRVCPQAVAEFVQRGGEQPHDDRQR